MLPSLVLVKCFKAENSSKLSQIMSLQLKPGRSKIRNTCKKCVHTHTVGNTLKKVFMTFFLLQFTGCTPSGKENKEVKHTSKLLLRVLAYAQFFQEMSCKTSQSIK